MPRVLVAGIGNIFLGDDGFGCEVVRGVLARSREHEDHTVVRDYGVGGIHLAYDLLEFWDALVLVDALPDHGRPGELRVFEADDQTLSATAGIEAHSMDPAAVMAMLRVLGGTPPRTIVVGCQVGVLSEGIGLSSPVRRAVPLAVDAIADIAAMLCRDVAAATELT